MDKTSYHATYEPTPRSTGVMERLPAPSEAGAVSLPEGYKFEPGGAIANEEIAGLMRQVEIGKDVTAAMIHDSNQRDKAAGYDQIDVGVRDEKGSLVGFSSMWCRYGFAEFGNFVVSPQHQSKGIGKSLIDERIRIADGLGVHTIEIEYFEPTNTLTSYYLEHGFHREIGRGFVRRHTPSVVLGGLALKSLEPLPKKHQHS